MLNQRCSTDGRESKRLTTFLVISNIIFACTLAVFVTVMLVCEHEIRNISLEKSGIRNPSLEKYGKDDLVAVADEYRQKLLGAMSVFWEDSYNITSCFALGICGAIGLSIWSSSLPKKSAIVIFYLVVLFVTVGFLSLCFGACFNNAISRSYDLGRESDELDDKMQMDREFQNRIRPRPEFDKPNYGSERRNEPYRESDAIKKEKKILKLNMAILVFQWLTICVWLFQILLDLIAAAVIISNFQTFTSVNVQRIVPSTPQQQIPVFPIDNGVQVQENLEIMPYQLKPHVTVSPIMPDDGNPKQGRLSKSPSSSV